jgi:hypothetical protein
MDKMDATKSPWISCFDNKSEDPWHMFKDIISLKLEEHITKVANQIHEQHPKMSQKDAQNLAINLLMERLLVLQKEHTPESQKAMIINLFIYLPELKDFRSEVIQEVRSRTGFVYKIKRFFSK